jgi:hypothetical protein
MRHGQGVAEYGSERTRACVSDRTEAATPAMAIRPGA